MKSIENICYDEMNLDKQKLDIHLPDSDVFPVLIYLHGGGIEEGDKTQTFFPYLQKKGIAVVSANYRLYPFASYPDFIKDSASAVAWTIKNMKEYGTPTKFFICGTSAGGYIAQMLCFDKKYLALHKIDADSIDGYILNSGQPTVHFNVLRERGIDHRRIVVDEAAPLYHICEERNYPPMNIIVADNDMENRLEQTNLLVSTLKHFGHENNVELTIMQDSKHCSYVGEIDKKGNSVFADVIYSFISKHI